MKYSNFSFLIIFLALPFFSQGQESGSDKIKILFVGNSLTDYNDLPTKVARIGASHGIKIDVQKLTYANYSLGDHLADTKLQLLISNGKFNYVVIQQGPSTGNSGKAALIKDTKRISRMCNKADAKLALMMVWPSKNNIRLFDNVIKSYSEAAEESNAILCPVGQVWKDYIESTNSYSYYGEDGFHPSEKGSEVAADVIYNSLFGK
ncbi:MAG: SGNH/GDSL hydrolase family protein [Saprospiraceae bacterium]|nr:SGNH/GDSL hydrolase family protein [Saprospiraceae bacterium]